MDVKKVLLLSAAAVLIYTMIVHPSTLADGVAQLAELIVEAVKAIFRFLREALSGIGDALSS